MSYDCTKIVTLYAAFLLVYYLCVDHGTAISMYLDQSFNVITKFKFKVIFLFICLVKILGNYRLIEQVIYRDDKQKTIDKDR